MAINLDKAGFPLRVHTRSRKAETNPELEGATPCSSPAAASTGMDVLLLCVSDDAAVEEVLFGANGAASQLGIGSVVLDCSTIAPATAQRCAERLARQNVHYLDAPVTGGTEGAKRGSLTVLVAGSYAAVAEAVALGQRLELPMPQVIDALKNGAAGSWALEHRSTAMLECSYPLGFRLSLHRKDLGIALDAAKAVQLDLPVTTLVEQLELDLIQNGHGDEDVSALHRWNQTRQRS